MRIDQLDEQQNVDEKCIKRWRALESLQMLCFGNFQQQIQYTIVHKQLFLYIGPIQQIYKISSNFAEFESTKSYRITNTIDYNK